MTSNSSEPLNINLHLEIQRNITTQTTANNITQLPSASMTQSPPEDINMGAYLRTLWNIAGIFFMYWLCMMTIFWIERKELQHYAHPNGRKQKRNRDCPCCRNEKANPFDPHAQPGAYDFTSPSLYGGIHSAHSYNSAFNSWASPTHQQRSPNTTRLAEDGRQQSAFDEKDFYG